MPCLYFSDGFYISHFTFFLQTGLDGTYSAVRQNLYKVLEAEGKLPKSDKEPLGVGYTCMVGVTEPMDPEKYPELKDGICHFKSVVGGARHNVSLYFLRMEKMKKISDD